MVVTPGVVGRQRVALVVGGARADELLSARVGERADGAVQAFRGERRRFPGARAETGTPKQPFGLLGPDFRPGNSPTIFPRDARPDAGKRGARCTVIGATASQFSSARRPNSDHTSVSTRSG